MCSLKLFMYQSFFLFFVKYISNHYSLKLNKLHENDSLSFLYIISSSKYTLIFLFLFLFFCIFKKRTTAYKEYIILFSLSLYFLYIGYFRNYAIIFIQNNSLNTSLQNGLLNIHPIFIYYMYVNIICI